MDEFSPIPFSEAENNIKWNLAQFIERDQDFAILSEKNNKTIPDTTNYRFGYILENEMFWLFNGKATATDRVIAIKAYNQLLPLCQQINAVPFAYKEYEKREP